MSSYVQKLVKLSNSISIADFITQENANIYHYTSPSGLDGILKNRTLRFTDRNYLNDYSEGRCVLELCLGKVNDIMPGHKKFQDAFVAKCEERLANPQRDNFFVYQCSFSLDADSLCLWNYYTKGDSIKGYNLKFNSTELCESLRPTSALDNGECPKTISGRIVYNETEQEDTIKKIVEAFFLFSDSDEGHRHLPLTIEILIDKLMFVGIFFKKDCFKIENEYRIAFDLHLNNNGDYTAIKEKQCFFEKGGSFIPYVDIPFFPTALHGIAISPTLDLETTRKSLLRITQKDFKCIDGIDKITKSNIPVRY